MSITAKSDLDYNKRWDNSLEKVSALDDETKLMVIPQLGLAPLQGWACENQISQDGSIQELTTHIRKNHVQNDVYRVDNAWFHSVGMEERLSWIIKKISKETTYMIAIIVLYLEHSRGPKMERAFRAIHQMRPARNSFMSLEKNQTAWEKNAPMRIVTSRFKPTVVNRKVISSCRKR